MDMQAIVKTVAPWIGTALTGPLGGMAVQAACSALGLGESTADALKQAVSGASPEQMLALKQADLEFSARMRELGFAQVKDLEALAVADRKDARAMQVAMRSKIPASLSMMVTGGYFAVLIGMLAGWFHASESQALLLMLGSLSTAWGMVMAFWFGTTAGSAAKTDLLVKK
jgi:hypothetical protein